nr:hypothetical protein [Burkholderia cenocepacia]
MRLPHPLPFARRIVALGAVAALTACSTLPRYSPPAVAVPAHYAGAPAAPAEQTGWHVAMPADAADLSLRLTTNRFNAGAVSYLDVVTAQTIALTNRRTADQIDARRIEAEVGLLKALGGGWQVSVSAGSDAESNTDTHEHAAAARHEPAVTQPAAG